MLLAVLGGAPWPGPGAAGACRHLFLVAVAGRPLFALRVGGVSCGGPTRTGICGGVPRELRILAGGEARCSQRCVTYSRCSGRAPAEHARPKADASNNQLAVCKLLAIPAGRVNWSWILLGSRRRRKNVVMAFFILRAKHFVFGIAGGKPWALSIRLRNGLRVDA